jgi:hypothetical protein
MFSSRPESLQDAHDEHDEHALLSGQALLPLPGQITPPLQFMPAVMHPVPVGQFALVMQLLHDGL